MLTPSPIRSPSLSSTTSPRCIPMRNSMRRSAGTPRCAQSCRIALRSRSEERKGDAGEIRAAASAADDDVRIGARLGGLRNLLWRGILGNGLLVVLVDVVIHCRYRSPHQPCQPLSSSAEHAVDAALGKRTGDGAIVEFRSVVDAVRTKPAQAAHLSIVVLPFANLSGDPAQDYFADGLTENLTTELSRIKDSFVIARNTAFTYKGKSIDAKEIGKELGVRYVLEGWVQRDQNRVRVNAQLVDAESGAHLWADRFEEDIADLFKLQDQVVARLANALGYELTRAEAKKGARSANPDAVDLSMRGWTVFWRELQQPVKEKRESSL